MEERPIAFVLAASANGMHIVNRFDGKANFRGVGSALLADGGIDIENIEMLMQLLDLRQRLTNRHLFIADIGANIGTFTIPLATHMGKDGTVIAFEPQKFIYYALCGNIVLNNCFNTEAVNAAVGHKAGSIAVPRLIYTEPGVFSGVNLMPSSAEDLAKDIGQKVTYDLLNTDRVRITTLDTEFAGMPFLDLVKIDVESMDLNVLVGAKDTLDRLRPMVFVETLFQKDKICAFLSEHGYEHKTLGGNTIALHRGDPVSGQVSFVDKSEAA